MTLKQCLDIGVNNRQKTVGKSMAIAELHIIKNFNLSYEEFNEEIKQMANEARELFNMTSFTEESSVIEVLEWIKLDKM